jgi:hypothetical protein
MPVEELWAAHRRGTPLDELRSLPRTAEEWFYLAVLEHGQGNDEFAAAAAERAARERPDGAVYGETSRYLDRIRRGGAGGQVYDSGTAFTAFVRGGGNVGLYRATHEALRSCYGEHASLRLLDIGTGEGHGLLPALTSRVVEVELVEPAEERLARVTAELDRRGLGHRAHATTAAEFVDRAEADPRCSWGSWDLVQETFALLTLDRAERAELLRWLRPRVKGLAFAEFDVPDLGSGMEPPWFHYMVERYERGIREYNADRELVAQSFLVPVLLSTLGDDGGQRHHEQPIARWVDDLSAAGFAPEPPRPLFDYWWARAYLLRAS